MILIDKDNAFFCNKVVTFSNSKDLLNEVMCLLLQKPPEHLSRLMEAKQDKYTELDFYILQMIKLNITSDTSPYRHKYKPIPSVFKAVLDMKEESFDI